MKSVHHRQSYDWSDLNYSYGDTRLGKRRLKKYLRRAERRSGKQEIRQSEASL